MRSFVLVGLIIGLGLQLSGCGVRGDLYMPQPHHAEHTTQQTQ